MFPKMVSASRGLWREVRNIFRRGRDVWRLVPAGQKRSLGLAVLVMAAAALASTAIPKVMGQLFNAAQRGVGGFGFAIEDERKSESDVRLGLRGRRRRTVERVRERVACLALPARGEIRPGTLIPSEAIGALHS